MSKLKFYTAASMLMLVAINHSAANEIELNISDDYVDVRMRSDFEQDFAGRAAYLYADKRGVDAHLLSYTFMASGRVEAVDVSMGVRPYLLDVGSDNGVGLALGAGASYEWVDKLSSSIELYYSPEIITGGDFDDMIDIEFRTSYQVIDNASVSLGYRWLDIETDSGDFDYDDLFVGVRLRF